jgi:hypothetical protein
VGERDQLKEMTRMFGRKAILVVVTAAIGVSLLGGAALAAFAPQAAPADTFSVLPQLAGAPVTERGPKPGDNADKLKAILDALVAKGVITQAQEDNILAALKDADSDKRKDGDSDKHKEDLTKRVFADLFEQSATYLGIAPADLKAKLPGTSLAAIANATPGKNRDGLVAALTTASTTAIDKALAEKKITQEQADKAKAGLAKRIAEFVDHTYAKVERKAVAPRIEMFIGDAVSAARDYLGVPATDLMTAMRAGKSLGEIADSIPGKSRAGLITAITSTANANINKAAAENKITAEQAATLNASVTAAVTKLVDRKMTTASNTTNKKPGR